MKFQIADLNIAIFLKYNFPNCNKMAKLPKSDNKFMFPRDPNFTKFFAKADLTKITELPYIL
jgi:hypothetical protein